jgi:hypothetical protein
MAASLRRKGTSSGALEAGWKRRRGRTPSGAGVVYLTPDVRFSHLLALQEGANLGRALNQAMEDIEKHNPDLADALPKNYGAMGDDFFRDWTLQAMPSGKSMNIC